MNDVHLTYQSFDIQIKAGILNRIHMFGIHQPCPNQNQKPQELKLKSRVKDFPQAKQLNPIRLLKLSYQKK
jgi:hypothetical protein